MNAKETLRQIRIIDITIKNITLEIEDIRNRMTGCGGISFEGEKVQRSSSGKSSQEKYYLVLIDKENELEKEIKKLIHYRMSVMEVLRKIQDANCVDLLYKRYFEYKTWEEIAVEMNYSYWGIQKMHSRALKEFERVHTSTHLNVL